MKKSMLFDERVISFAALVVGLFIFAFKFAVSEPKSQSPLSTDTALQDTKVSADIKPISLEEEFPHVIKRNIPLYSYLSELGAAPLDIIEMVEAAKSKKNLSWLAPGTRFQVVQSADKKLEQVRFRFSPIESLTVIKTLDKWSAKTTLEKVELKNVSFVGEVDSTLWESAKNAHMDPYLIVAMAEIFAWVVDFNREVRVGDKWRITAERKLVKGEHVGWGSILAAEYVNSGESHKANLFRDKGEDIGYYDLEGNSLRKMFLKSPLRFGRVTSHFNKRRFHPKLKRIRPHNGVDYGAPIGTPVRAVADGKVTFARRRGGGGKTLKLRHNSKYKTAYKHLSRFGKGIKPGVKVRQGQVVAYVGNTGLSTGPHLHYEFFINNRFVDPLKQKFPSADPIAQKYRLAFGNQSKQMMATLPKWEQENFVVMSAGERKTSSLTPQVKPQFSPLLKADL